MTTDGATGRYNFGPFQLEAAARVLSRSGQPLALAPKTFDLLLLLVENQGRVLTKSQLMTSLWTETFVEEANLSFQISTLRKTLGDEGAAWIETVPKVGYRFSGPVQMPAGTKSEAAPVVLQQRPNFVWIMAAGAVAALAVTIWVVQGRESAAPSLELVPLTSYEGVEREPSFSPDGSQVAFAWNGEKQGNFDIYVKAIGSGTPLRLTTDPARDCMPAWSPDGRYIAFQRNGQGIYLVHPTGGAERKLLSPVSHCAQLSWSPDGKHLSFSRPASGGEPAGIFVIAIETGSIHRLTRADPAVAPVNLEVFASNVHHAAAFSPDGSSLAFASGSDPGDPNSCDIMMLSLDAELKPRGSPRVVFHQLDDASTIAWTEDGQSLVGSTYAPDNSRLWKVAARSGATPEELVFAGANSFTPATSRNGHRMAFTRGQGNSDIWIIESDGTLTRSPLSSTFEDVNPQFSPDGRKVAFASARSGKMEVWVANSDGSAPVQLTYSASWSGGPKWSADGRWITFGTKAANGEWDISVVDAAGGSPFPAVHHPASDGIPTFSKDGKWIYFYSSRDARNDVYRIPATGGQPVRVTDNGARVALESADGKSIYYSKVNVECGAPLFVRSLAGGPERRILDSVCARGFVVTERGIYYLDRPLPDRILTVRLFDPATGNSQEIRKSKMPLYSNVSLTVSPDGRTMLTMGRAGLGGSDLYLVEKFR